MSLEEAQFAVIRSKDSLAVFEVFEQLRVLAQIVNSVCIENDDFVLSNASNKMWEEFLHVAVTSKPRADHPRVDRLLPGTNFVNPLLVDFWNFFRPHLNLLF